MNRATQYQGSPWKLNWKFSWTFGLGLVSALAMNAPIALAQSTSSSSSSSSQQATPYFHDNIFSEPGDTVLCTRLIACVLSNYYNRVPAGIFMHQQAGKYFEKGQLDDAFYSLESSYSEDLKSYTNRNLNPIPMSLNVAQLELLRASKATDSATALVYPTIFPDRVELLVIPSSGKPIHRTVRVAESEIVPTIDKLREDLRDASSNDYLDPAQNLYKWIISPIDDDLQAAKIKTLIFVMDGPLRVIPIAALHDGKEFLVQKYALATVPTMGLANFKLRDRRKNNILAMGLTESVQGFSALPGVEVEVNNISKVLEGSSFLNQTFTLSNLQSQQEKQNYGIVHLATHGKFVSNTIDGAFIQFWNERLYINDIPQLKFSKSQLELLTLSACETAVGNNLGISGMAAQSGVKSVLASLWTVSDAGTMPLMLSFYSEYPTATSKAIAMQKAQISLIEGKVRIQDKKVIGIPNLSEIPVPKLGGDINLKHPYYWSSFILVGNWL
ncbi:CHAT domain-containing protein [Tumidithrix elongata RA019]|uniref:CHAT domain-containing protein n=1 Tax=Tumidithrix elongata BACA0141 TaxID=2716417 RepID=A0AAW9PT06_9CYAN|nr:CHAT domain-containing protein [Tumidithrix elongata RA019]